MPMHEKLIFEHSRPGRSADGAVPGAAARRRRRHARSTAPRARRRCCPRCRELQAVRHFTRLSQLNFSIDTHFYPLGSCTMKYNPRACNQFAMLPEFLDRHPLAPDSTGQGFLQCMFELQEMLKEVTGMQRRVAHADGRRAGRVRRRRDDPRLSPGARRPRAQRDHRARRGARHQPGDRDDVRLHGAARFRRIAERRHRRRGAAARRSARRPPASC